ncbi:hypothetical protein I4U23_022641 [Adineta vaga]|nr:hypothetical protein I4U23_022641 [Adineta vaga]
MYKGISMDIEGSFVDNTIDRVVDEFIPDKNGEIGRMAETGINQFINNEINSKLTPGAFDGNAGQNQGEKKFW